MQNRGKSKKEHTMPKKDLSLALWWRWVCGWVCVTKLKVCLDVYLSPFLKVTQEVVLRGTEGDDVVPCRSSLLTGWSKNLFTKNAWIPDSLTAIGVRRWRGIVSGRDGVADNTLRWEHFRQGVRVVLTRHILCRSWWYEPQGLCLAVQRG